MYATGLVLKGLAYIAKRKGIAAPTWPQFVQALRSYGYVLDITDPGPGAVIGFDTEGKGRLLFTGATEPADFVIAVSAAVGSSKPHVAQEALKQAKQAPDALKWAGIRGWALAGVAVLGLAGVVAGMPIVPMVATAMFNVGVLYDNGWFVTQDYVKAREWFEKAADQGDTDAMFNLGLLYANGQGVAQDYVKAREWYEKAAAKDNATAIGNHKGKPLSERDARLWEHVIVEDFAEFRKAGLTHPMMASVEKELGISP